MTYRESLTMPPEEAMHVLGLPWNVTPIAVIPMGWPIENTVRRRVALWEN